MAAPLQDFGRVIRGLVRVFRYASYLLIGTATVVMVREISSVFRLLHDDVHPSLAWFFLVLCAVALYIFAVRPAQRYWRVPEAIRPPGCPGRTSLTSRHLDRRLRFIGRYLQNLRQNPAMIDRLEEVDRVLERCKGLRADLDRGDLGEVMAAVERLEAFETQEVDPLLKPLDEEANRVIRAEALAVGLGTAVSMNGTVDAFIVLWRNANLVARIATIYYGRPGLRGSLVVVRDVATAMSIAVYMQGVMEAAGALVGGWIGKTGNLLLGPVGDGAVNSVVTLRIGYLAKGRCRSFRRWNEDTISAALSQVAAEVAKQGAGVAKDVVRTTVKGGLVKIPVEAAKRAGGFLGSLFTPRNERVDPV